MNVEEKAVRAKQLLDDPLIVEMLDRMTKEVHRQFEREDLDDAAIKEAWYIGKMVRRFQAMFQQYIQDQVVAIEQAKQYKRDEFRP